MTLPIYQHVLEECLKAGVKEFCICPGSRNSPLVNCLNVSSQVIKHFWFEERSAAFFALGRARQTQAPVAVVTTSGTAHRGFIMIQNQTWHSKKNTDLF